MNLSRRCFFHMNSATLDTLAPKLSGPSLRQALVASARQLQPLLERNAARTETCRAVVEENLTAIRSAGLLKLAVPRRFGGLETDIRTMVEVSRELGRGCGSTAWVSTVSNSASRFLGTGPLEAQNDVWGHGPDAILFGSMAGMPTVKKVSDGLVVSGKWTYASGCLHADWGLLVVPLCDESGEKTGQALGLCRASELVIEDTYGVQEVKLPAGHAIVYPGTSLHQVRPVTRGARVSSFFWVQSLVRDDTQRAMLFDIDGAIQRLNASNGDEAARRSLVGCYHNLLRMWSDT